MKAAWPLPWGDNTTRKKLMSVTNGPLALSRAEQGFGIQPVSGETRHVRVERGLADPDRLFVRPGLVQTTE